MEKETRIAAVDKISVRSEKQFALIDPETREVIGTLTQQHMSDGRIFTTRDETSLGKRKAATATTKRSMTEADKKQIAELDAYLKEMKRKK
ncbi:hypothetical protein [Paenibacillus sp. Soil787]|uniref:hypothetical protein n=1 Tax=Paenibacillus sp. Soil787 TaxID=1736411 RepID=UPI0006F2E304|nr:hypothetical protein [Paenibacillus sp. Soil787]KRF31950.1 hypothetical protein ASG93_06415 [Paenibacillus sp. Soil787]